ncbi:MAG TPA: dihydrofolate reductase family protein [Microlunatus sp.]
MSRLTCQISVSLDGFVAGPSQGPEDPLGAGGMRLHDWLFAGEGPQLRAGIESCGAFIMGRNMFGPGRGTWDESWRGWWGGNPYHQPVFVLTHHERATLPVDDDAPFHFVTTGIVSALERARAVAGDRNVMVAGGAQTVRQFLAAGLLDELLLTVTPVLLGSGERLLVDVGHPLLEQVETIVSPSVTHVRYRVAS